MVTVKQFEAPTGAEIMGIGIMGVFENLQQKAIDPILTQYDLNRADIDTESWYALQIYYDLYRELADMEGSTSNLVAIGKATARNVTNPDEVETIGNFINVELNRASAGVIRNTPQGYGYTIEKVDDNHYLVTNNTGAPNDVVYGYIWESLRLLADGKPFKFVPVKNYPSHEWGATFRIEW